MLKTAIRRLARACIHALDRGAGRSLLSTAVTVYARRATGDDVALVHDAELWMHRRSRWYFPDGERFDYNEASIRLWLADPDQYFENARRYWYKAYTPKAGDVIFDIGAGRGEDVLPFSTAVGPGGRVVAVESHPATFRLLKKLCDANGLSNVVPIHAAAAASVGRAHVLESSNGLWMADTVDDQGEGPEVATITVDRLCEDLGLEKISFLKMNIEGAERQALEGMRRTLPRIDALCICCHDFRADRGHGEAFRTREFVREFLNSNGFEVRTTPFSHDYERDHLHAVRAG